MQTDLDCLSGVLNVTWQSTGHAPSFRASVMSSKGHVSACETDKHHCLVNGLQCGLTYNVTVVAQDEACNSSHGEAAQVTAGENNPQLSMRQWSLHSYTVSVPFLPPSAPCPLTSFRSTVDCGTGLISVTWTDNVVGVVNTVSAVDPMGRTHNCSGATSGCDLNTLECGTNYSVTITPSRDGCVGRDSTTQMITTGKDHKHILFYCKCGN